jgi:hypothetical protein
MFDETNTTGMIILNLTEEVNRLNNRISDLQAILISRGQMCFDVLTREQGRISGMSDLESECRTLRKAYDRQSHELSLACEIMTTEQLTKFRRKAYPSLYKGGEV